MPTLCLSPMNKLLATICCLIMSTVLSSVVAEDNLLTGSTLVQKLELSERTINPSAENASITIRKDEAGDVLIVEHKAGQPADVLLLKLDKPAIQQRAYVIAGQVRYENVKSDGYLEMLNRFTGPLAGEYFTRSLAEQGPMGKLIGTSPWREFQLPFFINMPVTNAQPDDLKPADITLRVHLPGEGHVELRSLELREMPLPKEMQPAAPPKAVTTVRWQELAKANKLPKEVSVVEEAGQGTVIKIERGENSPQLIELTTLEKPAIQGKAYALRGRIRYENVDAIGYVEMWNNFPEPKKGSYFSRTMAPSGPLGHLKGSSPWRELQIPFFINQPGFPAPTV